MMKSKQITRLCYGRQVGLFFYMFICGCTGGRVCEKPKSPDVPQCSGECEAYYSDSSDITDYDFVADSRTPSGIVIDSSYLTDLEIIDALISELEQCLGMTIDRECLAIKIAPDWYISECTGTELFPCDFPDSWCAAIKPPDSPCPCACAGVVQNGNIVIVTPNLAAIKHELLHVILGVSDAEIDSRDDLAQCL